MPVLYALPGLRRRLGAGASARVDQMAGALAECPRQGVAWRLTEAVTGVAAIYGLEVYGGAWPDGAKPTVRWARGAFKPRDCVVEVPASLHEVLRQLQVDSWEALVGDRARAFRFRPLGASHVVSILPPMRYTRGLNADEAALVVKAWMLSADMVGLQAPA